MDLSADAVIHLLTTYGYVVLFPLAIVEGPIVTILGGVFAAAGHMNVAAVYIIVVLGDLVGDVLYYEAGKHGRTAFARYLARPVVRRPAAQLAAFERRFLRHGWKTLVIGKWTQSVGALVLVAAGAARLPFRKFLIINFLATLPKSFLLLMIGYYAGWAFIHLLPRQYVTYIGGASLAVGLLLLWRLLASRTGAKGPQA